MSSVPNHEIVRVRFGREGDEDRQDCYNVRINVFHHEQGFPLDAVIDELDETAEHFLIRLLPSRQPIGTVRACRTSRGHGAAPSPSPSPYYKLGRLAVLRDFRKQNFGRELMFALHRWLPTDARSRGESDAEVTVTVVCHSQIAVKAFYAKLGYTPEGNEFDEHGTTHQKMVTHLPLSP